MGGGSPIILPKQMWVFPAGCSGPGKLRAPGIREGPLGEGPGQPGGFVFKAPDHRTSRANMHFTVDFFRSTDCTHLKPEPTRLLSGT